jgi:phosphatidylglycerol:prolipoprotein diacylglycerol transferase
VLAHAIGRVGCFLNGCCYGKPSSLPWAVAFPFNGVPRHPTQLYEMGALLTLFFILKALERKKLKAGTLFLIYGLSYGIWRFGVEFLRGDSTGVLWNLTVFQLASIALVFGFLLILSLRSTFKN